MTRKSWLAVGFGLVLASAGARADDTYAIKIKEPGKGDVVRVDSSDVTDSRSKLVGPDGKTLVERDDKTTRSLVYRETVLEKEPGKRRPGKLERTYEKAEVTTKGKPETLPYEGKTVIIEKTGKEYHFRIKDGAELTGDDARLLTEEFNHDAEEEFDVQKAILPQKAVALNETWKLDMGPVAAAYTRTTKLQFDASKAEGTGKLVKVYDRDGARFGVLELHLELPIKEIGEGPTKMAMKPGAKWTMDLTLDGCIDGSRIDGTRESLSRIDGVGRLQLQPDQEGTLTLSVKGDGKETSKEVKK